MLHRGSQCDARKCHTRLLQVQTDVEAKHVIHNNVMLRLSLWIPRRATLLGVAVLLGHSM
jgi:hypothetical protein